MTSSSSPAPVPAAPSSAPQPFKTLPGRLVLLTGGLLALLYVARLVVELPDILVLFRRVAGLGFVLGAGWLGLGFLARQRRQLLWRVRTKLILSYVFLGLVPVVLVVTFALAGGVVLYNNIAAYMFDDGLRDIYDDVRQAADTVAAEVTRNPGEAAAALARTYANVENRYPGLSLAAVPAPTPPASPADGNGGMRAPATPPVTAGPWRHQAAPATIPYWSLERSFSGLIALDAAGPGLDEDMLVIRVVATTGTGRTAIVADLPIDTAVTARLDDRTGTRVRGFGMPCTADVDTPLRNSRGDTDAGTSSATLFSRAVVFTDCVVNWQSGALGRLPVSLNAPIGRLYERLVSVQLGDLSEMLEAGDVFLLILGTVGVLFLVVQGAALIMGAMLARSITYAVHELFVGTERIQQGDFAHRIRIDSKDQLGDLAGSFNKMSSSIEHLLHVEREKQRMDEELRIAREIQRSLLPHEPPRMDGLSIADLCEPAREVGGDYYDFFVLGPRRLGVLMADVSGKGTSAALYMAEAKGLLLALSHDEPSPRQLLIEVNRRLAGQLDNRSFITMTYAIVDLDAGLLTHARAGHTPLIVASNGGVEVLQPDGMVLGLCLPGAEARFASLLEEHQRPIREGDVVVLYTDGVTEAMDAEGELFGDEGLARVVQAHRRLDAAGIRERVVREVRAFAATGEPHDDMTMVILKLRDQAGGAA